MTVKSKKRVRASSTDESSTKSKKEKLVDNLENEIATNDTTIEEPKTSSSMTALVTVSNLGGEADASIDFYKKCNALVSYEPGRTSSLPSPELAFLGLYTIYSVFPYSLFLIPYFSELILLTFME